jgi:hypothetical protein
MRHLDVTGGISGAVATLSDGFSGSQFGGYEGASIQGDNLSVAGRFKLDNHDYGTGAYVEILLISSTGTAALMKAVLRFDPDTFEWWLWTNRTLGPAGAAERYQFSSTFDVSSWYAHDTWVGFRLQTNRYKLQARVWEDSAGEPVTWDYDDYVALGTNPASPGPEESIYAYDYSGAPLVGPGGTGLGVIQANNDLRPHTVRLVAHVGEWPEPRSELEIHWDDIEVYRGVGEDSTDDMSVAVENPHGTLLDEITIPNGAEYMVYWGYEHWSEPVETDPDFWENLFNFSSRNWMHGGHLLNRAKTFGFIARLPVEVARNQIIRYA